MIDNEEKLALSDETKQIIDENLKKHGKISICFLMRKLKCSASIASDVLQKYRIAT